MAEMAGGRLVRAPHWYAAGRKEEVEEEEGEEEEKEEEEEEEEEEERGASGGAEEAALAWLLAPLAVDHFYAEHWERRPLHVRRGAADYYAGKAFSMAALAQALAAGLLRYGRNVDVTHYSRAGRREDLNGPVGEALPAARAWRLFHDEGATLRLLHPQEYSDSLYALCGRLQEHFGCVVGCNIYVTPPASQGFAPHYDDVDVFILQLEGSKHWCIYEPLDEASSLPQYSSRNFSQEEVGEPILEVLLEQGDLLYLPRGMIHQACSGKEEHSMHATVSTMQRNTWGHLAERVAAAAVRSAFRRSRALRRVPPPAYLLQLGSGRALLRACRGRGEAAPEAEAALVRQALALARAALAEAGAEEVHEAADELGRALLHDCLPPPASVSALCPPAPSAALASPSARVCLAGPLAARLTVEAEGLRVYYSTSNSRAYREVPPQFLEFPPEAAHALALLFSGAEVCVASLPLQYEEDRLAVAQALLDVRVLRLLP